MELKSLIEVTRLTGSLRLAPKGPLLDGAAIVTAPVGGASSTQPLTRERLSHAVVALSWWRGRKAEFWIDVQSSPPATQNPDFDHWCSVFNNKRGSRGIDVAASHETRGWTGAIVDRVADEAGVTFECMIGHLAGVNKKLFHTTHKTCLRFDLDPHLARSIAAASTTFYQSRWNAGFHIADIAEYRSEVWIRMFKSDAAFKELATAEPLYEGAEWAPDQDEFSLLKPPGNA